MSYQSEDDRLSFRKVIAYWPIILTAGAVVVSAAQANTRLDGLSDKVEYIYQKGAPPTAERLARIEERQIAIEKEQKEMNETLVRIEGKIDDKYSVSPEAQRKLRKL